MNTNGMTPAEIRKHYDEAAAKAIREEKAHQDFLALIQTPEVKRAAVAAARALSALDKLGLQVVDYCAVGRKVEEVELESTTSYDKAWIRTAGLPQLPIED